MLSRIPRPTRRERAPVMPLVGVLAKALLLAAAMLHPAIASAAEPKRLQAAEPGYAVAALRNQQP